MEIRINGHVLDLEKAVPLTLGDWDHLQKQKVLKESGEVEMKGAQTIIKLVTYLASKVDKNITEADVKTMPLKDVNIVATWIQQQMTQEDAPADPLSGSSIPSG